MDQRHAVDSLRWGATTHAGRRRAVNEDAFHAERGVYFVADGMGGHEAGARASAAAVEVLCSLSEPDNVSLEQLHAVVREAHRAVAQIATQPGRHAGTTMTGAVAVQRDGVPTWLVANVGDSRTYRFVEQQLHQITVDHSLVQELVSAGEVSPEEAKTFARRHVITRALGGAVDPEPDCWSLPMVPGERLIICSDGLTEDVSTDQIAEVLRQQPHPQLAADQLVNCALLAGGRDNVTVVVVDVATSADRPTSTAPAHVGLPSRAVPA